MPNLEESLNQLKQCAFPSFPEDDALSNWVEELAEFDGYVVGIAASATAGGQLNIARLNKQSAQFRLAFTSLSRTYPEPKDNHIYQACGRYLELVEGVVRALNWHVSVERR